MEKEKGDKRLHTLRKNKTETSHPLPPISCGKKDRELLIHLRNLDSRRFNLKSFSRETKRDRSSIYDSLNRLEKKGLVIREKYNNRLSEQGKRYLQVSSGVSESVGNTFRQECRTNQLSTHWHKFKLKIKDKSKFRLESLKRLNPKEIKENNLQNLHQIIVTFEDIKLIINPKQVIISLSDIVSEDIDETDVSSFTKVISYTEKLKSIGIETEQIMIEEGHWARVESPLSEFLKKVDERYYLELSDGSKLWIDNSPKNGKQILEEETNNKLVRERIDNSLNLLGTGQVDLNDINSLKELAANILKIEYLRTSREINTPKSFNKELKHAEYIN